MLPSLRRTEAELERYAAHVLGCRSVERHRRAAILGLFPRMTPNGSLDRERLMMLVETRVDIDRGYGITPALLENLAEIDRMKAHLEARLESEAK